MANRIEEDAALAAEAARLVIQRPVVIIEHLASGSCQFRLFPNELDPLVNQPVLFGILLSDLIDHIAHLYCGTTGRDERALREEIAKVMRDESRFKDKDPSRSQSRGATVWPAKN